MDDRLTIGGGEADKVESGGCGGGVRLGRAEVGVARGGSAGLGKGGGDAERRKEEDDRGGQYEEVVDARHG